MDENKQLAIVSAQEVTTTLAKINTSVTNNLAALSAVKEIKTDADDAKAEKLLVATRATFNKVQALRMPITQALNSMIDMLIEPENKISNDAKKKDSEYNRIKQLRDTYANEKFKKAQEEKRRIKLDQAKKDEFIRLKTEAEKLFLHYMQDQLVALDQKIAAVFNAATVADFANVEKKFNVPPKLNPEVFESQIIKLENLPYGDIDAEEFQTLFLDPVKQQYTYDFFNAEYIRQATPIMEAWKKKLPERKKELEKLEALREKDAIKAKAEQDRIQKDQEREALKRAEEAEEKRKKEEAELERKQNEAKLENQFEAAVATQVVPESVGGRTVRKAKIVCEPRDIVRVLGKVLFQCYMNPKFPGHIRKDQSGNPIGEDINGVVPYNDWCQTLLDFFVANCDASTVEGIQVIEYKSTIAKK